MLTNIKFKNCILILSCISGIFGLAYEILYMQLIANYIAEIFYIVTATLATFFLGMTLGSLYATKYNKYLPHIEIATGVYAIAISLIIAFLSEKIISWSYFFDTLGPYAITLFVITVLFIPSILIGSSIPLYVYHYSKLAQKSSKSPFNKIYILYNLGAIAAILLLELLIIKEVGIVISTILIGIGNISIGLYLYNRFKKTTLNTKKEIHSPLLNLLEYKKKYGTIVLLNIITGILYSCILVTTNALFGPYRENFAIILSISLLGIVLSTVYIHYSKNISLNKVLYILALLVPLSFVLIDIFINIFFQIEITTTLLTSILFKIVFLTLLFIPVFIFFGSIEPLFLQISKKQLTPGNVLASSSFGLSLGFIIMNLFLYATFSLLTLIISCSLGLFFLSKIYLKKYALFFTCIYVIVLFILSSFFPGDLLQLGFKNYHTIQEHIQEESLFVNSINHIKQAQHSATLIEFSDQSTWFIHEGYLSLVFSKNQVYQQSEQYLGLGAVPLINSTNLTLVLGLGSGITVGALSEVFTHVEVSEINPTMIEISKKLSERNYNVVEKENVDITIEDGLTTLMKSHKTYDLIVNNVPPATIQKSSKLWTQETFSKISSKLNPHGIYLTWYDQRLGNKGIAILHKTLKSVFNNCTNMFLSNNYYITLCSNEPLKLHEKPQSVYSKKLQNSLNKENISTSITKRYFSTPLTLFNSTTPINTYTYPVLEFIHRDEMKFNEEKLIFTNFNKDPFSNRNLSEKEILKKCEFYRNNFNNIPQKYC